MSRIHQHLPRGGVTKIETFRDYCRERAAWSDPRLKATQISGWCREDLTYVEPRHQQCTGQVSAFYPPRLCACKCHPIQAGPPAAERALWTQIADEIDAFLSERDSGQGDLFGGGS